jgi:hemoglobin-like flavoprotein
VKSTQIALVQSSFKHVRPIADQAAALFYDRLFMLDPSLRLLFPSDLTEQRRKLMQTLAVVVANLAQLERLLPTIHGLGERHAAYGVEPEHYEIVGEALLWTLEQGLGKLWTPELAEAWAEAYGVVAEAMQAGSLQVSVR